MSQLSSLALIPEDNAALSEEIARLAGHINATQHRFLTLLSAFIERDAWEGSGIKSPAQWLNYHCGIDLGAAREKVRVTKSLSTLPAIDEAFRCRTIIYSKVRAMTRSATPENEQMLVLRGRMTPEDRAVFMKAVEAMVAAQNPPVTQDDASTNLSEKTFPQKRVDTLLALAEQALSTMEEGLQQQRMLRVQPWRSSESMMGLVWRLIPTLR